MTNWNFISFNFPDRMMRHRNFLGGLTPMDNLVGDFAFTLVGRGQHQVSFRSVNVPRHFLRHRDFRIHLDKRPATPDELFDLDSTFFFEVGLAEPEAFSFRSVNFPDRYLRHRDFQLFVEPPAGPDDELFRRDATFTRQPAAVRID